ncbi:hypothetical protein SAMN05428981_10947 [Bacillus sp. OV194]|nr:hypothetical protein SAMN05428981_10947 [Bacillus sp. OV194]
MNDIFFLKTASLKGCLALSVNSKGAWHPLKGLITALTFFGVWHRILVTDILG